MFGVKDHPYKYPMTRPDFLSVFICDGEELKSFDDVQKILPSYYDLIYCAYSAMMASGIHKSDINYVDIDDDDNLVIKVDTKDLARKIVETCPVDIIRIGDKRYKVSVKNKDRHLTVKIKLTNPEVLDHMILGMCMNA